MKSRLVGRWRINFVQMRFEHPISGYEIHFHECTTSDDVIGLIFHIHKKRIDAMDTFDLIEAMDRAFRPEDTLSNRPADLDVIWTREQVEDNYRCWEYERKCGHEREKEQKAFIKKHPQKLT